MISQQDIVKAKVLIVDDQKLYIRLLEEILKTAGYTNIYSTTNSRQILSSYDDVRPDIVLLDLSMPNVDGLQVIQELNKAKGSEYLPILALSGELGQEARVAALKAGATDYLNKPFESIEVLMRIRNMLQTRILHQQVRDHNRFLDAKVTERTKELQETRLDIIRRLARAAEYRDNDTGIHIVRMSHYCARLAAAAGMSAQDCDLILNASPLHDIGKIGIPDTVLLKPGKLTPDEWKVMRNHPRMGAELLSGSASELMKMAQVIALTHHEKWNGTGYPEGLKGKKIPLVGRICSLCDVFDALTTARPYKKAWPVSRAVEEIKKENGKSFDPDIVNCFVSILSDIKRIKRQHQD